ncbi:MAG: sigma factor-like helix-turn-helix DNA-binding protein [Actinomycetota bacterium]|nr:sigma factor-like helix-turn-helix DNA-binding protein [Actinomycetota bacterium]
MVGPLPLSPPPLANPSDLDPFRLWLDELACDVVPIHDLLSSMLSRHSRDDRERAILTARFGLNGEDRATLEEIGDQQGVSRERVRQLVDRSVMRVAGRALKCAEDKAAGRVVTERSGPAADVEPLVRRLTLEVCATDTGPLTKNFAALKLRLAGHRISDTEQLASEVRSRAGAVRRRFRSLERVEYEAAVADSRATSHLQRWLGHAEWPSGTAMPPSRPIPDRAIRRIAVNEEGHGATFFEKIGRDAAWDSGFEARLLQILNDSSLVATFQEQPVCVPYQWGRHTRSYYPDVVARLRDGRTVLIEAKPIYEVAYAVNQDKFDAGRAYAHHRGWGWLVWTDRYSIPELMRRDIDPVLAERITTAVASGDLDWSAVRRFIADGIELLDLISLTLANRWRWEREPFRLSATDPKPANLTSLADPPSLRQHS